MQQHRTWLSGSVLFLSEKAILYFFAGGDRPVPDDILWCNTILRLKPHNLSGLICVKLRCPICLASAKLYPPFSLVIPMERFRDCLADALNGTLRGYGESDDWYSP